MAGQWPTSPRSSSGVLGPPGPRWAASAAGEMFAMALAAGNAMAVVVLNENEEESMMDLTDPTHPEISLHRLEHWNMRAISERRRL